MQAERGKLIKRPHPSEVQPEKIVEQKLDASGNPRFLVKWRDYDDAHNTWQPYTYFKDKMALLSAFELVVGEGKLLPAPNEPVKPKVRPRPLSRFSQGWVSWIKGLRSRGRKSADDRKGSAGARSDHDRKRSVTSKGAKTSGDSEQKRRSLVAAEIKQKAEDDATQEEETEDDIAVAEAVEAAADMGLVLPPDMETEPSEEEEARHKLRHSNGSAGGAPSRGGSAPKETKTLAPSVKGPVLLGKPPTALIQPKIRSNKPAPSSNHREVARALAFEQSNLTVMSGRAPLVITVPARPLRAAAVQRNRKNHPPEHQVQALSQVHKEEGVDEIRRNPNRQPFPLEK